MNLGIDICGFIINTRKYNEKNIFIIIKNAIPIIKVTQRKI